MSGVAGILSFTRARADTRQVERMLELLDRRGPDDRGVRRSANGRMALGGCRPLRHESEALAGLPLTSESEDVWAVLDGEIGNHRALRHSLRLDGHYFRSEAAGEVAVHAYEQYGLSFLDHLHGSFALALWDLPRHRLVLARDRLGERPLYWTRGEGMLAFASEAKALLQALPMPRRLALEHLPEFLAQGFILAPNTLLEGIHKLGPGEALVVERANRMQSISWWGPCRDERRSAAVRALPPEHHENNLRILLDSAIADRLAADLPIAAILDGEPESLAMAASMARLLGRSVDALALGEDVASSVAAVGSSIGLRVTSVAPGEAQMAARLGDYLGAIDEPLAEPTSAGIWWLARAMSNSGLAIGLASFGAPTALLGSELLARHPPGRRRLLGTLPSLGRRLGRRLLLPLLVVAGKRGRADAFRSGLDGSTQFPCVEPLFADPAAILGPEFKWLGRSRVLAEGVMRLWRMMPAWLAADELAALAFVEALSSVPERQLMAVDRMSMAHSVELRLPFLDDALIDYALAVPSAERAPGGRPKDLLLRALRGLLPAGQSAELARPPGEPAASRWFRGGMGEVFGDLVRHGRVFSAGLFDPEACLTMLREHREGRRDHHRRLWTLLILAQWVDLLGLEMPVDLGAEPADAIPLSQ